MKSLGDFNGVEFLLKEHRALVDAEFGLNEGGRGYLKHGSALDTRCSSEKVYQISGSKRKTREAIVRCPQDNAIYHLAAGLDRLARFDSSHLTK